MNAISFLSNALPAPQEVPIKEKEGILVDPTPTNTQPNKVKNKTTTASTTTSTTTTSTATNKRNRPFMRWIWCILIFLPNYLLIKPIITIWYVITFPLNLMETNTQGNKGLIQVGSETDSRTEKLSKYVVEEDLSPTDEIIINQDKMKPRPITEYLGKFHFPKKLVPQSMLLSTSRKLLVLDLDETLIHSMSNSRSLGNPTDKNPSGTTPMIHLVEVRFPQTNISTLYNVAKRPYCDMFLQQTSQWYDIAIFTASMKEYADPVIDWLQQTCSVQFHYRWYREDCTLRPGVGYVKDIGTVATQIETSRDLSQMIIIDNSPISYAMHLDNAIQVHGWINDPSDSELLHLLPLLKAMRHVTDSRCILALKSGRASISN
ncbi:Nem1-Spo7 phosphatase catalytic subunit NEM1 [Kluyveromyces lactis]|uniref:KLLA0E18613p n=1 Tax=Kluyveromyces lactis (strain ATCC 8585 / CBS 2359 / DSM 70799 / NBRC 1267 / NRRL Y-1140 / WM37) TaxID=284590 RepID=Q6CMP7_KLULA|nr:uncharacterized protein KLLA0_E18613g [Kluyveromyces lactis]CAG99879.1 KLLA0E18613p [Kluyveromyces lactis]|eukprot:XP_454792.1 uncharacterized protein KLLA0_E18613g [Kluyveromyces lactis]